MHMKFFNKIIPLFVLLIVVPGQSNAQIQDLGSVFWVAQKDCPSNYSAKADGSVLAVESNEDLFEVLSKTYGGDGFTTFALPNLLGRTTVGSGTSIATGNQIVQGAMGGQESYMMKPSDLPSHTHSTDGITVEFPASITQGTLKTPTNSLASGQADVFIDSLSSSNTVTMNNGGMTTQIQTLSVSTISGQTSEQSALDTRSPYQVLTPCIVTSGNVPVRP